MSTGTCLENLEQKLFFLIGKGGVGRSTICSSLASYFSQKKEKVLIVQWSLSDNISSLFMSTPVGHSEREISFSFTHPSRHLSFSVMNYLPRLFVP